MADGAAPRPIAPASLGDVAPRRPTLRWSLPAGLDGAEVQLCRDRACTMGLATLTATGGSDGRRAARLCRATSAPVTRRASCRDDRAAKGWSPARPPRRAATAA